MAPLPALAIQHSMGQLPVASHLCYTDLRIADVNVLRIMA